MVLPPMEEVSVVVPAYNEELVLEDSIARIAEILGSGSELIVVNGGSTDGTRSVLEGIELDGPRFRALHSDTRLLKGEAIERGIGAAEHERICFVDADLPVPVDEIGEVVSRLDDAGIAVASRYLPGSDAARPLRREVPSRVYNRVVRSLFATGIRDHQCGCKAFRRSAMERILPAVGARHWFWDTEVIIEARRHDIAVAEVPVRWDNHGESQFSIVPALPNFLGGIGRKLVQSPFRRFSKSDR